MKNRENGAGLPAGTATAEARSTYLREESDIRISW
jgi:hypothetical protein